MPRYPGNERSLRGHRPGFDVAFEEVGVLFEESGRRPVSPFTSEGGRADERRDVGGDGGWRIATGLLPSLLLGRRSMEKEVAGRPHHHRIGVEVPEVAFAQQAPRQEDREGDLIELNPPPVRLAVDPEILGKPAVLVLADGQVDQGTQRRLGVPRGEEARGRIDHVPRPYEVISPTVVVALGLSPRDRQRGDEGSGVRLVFVGEKKAVTPVIEVPAIGRRLFEREDTPARPVPLVRVPFPLLPEGNSERFQERRHSVVQSVAEREPHRELPAIAQVQLAGEGDISIRSPVELPVHPIIDGEVRPAVALTHVTAGQAREGEGRAQREPDTVLLGGQDFPARDFHHAGVVSPPPHPEVGGAQGVKPEFFQERFTPREGRVHEEARQVRVGEDLLDDGIAPLRVGVRDPVSEDVMGKPFRHGSEMTLFLVEETLPVRDKELEIPELRPIHGRVVDLGDDTVPDGEPEPA